MHVHQEALIGSEYDVVDESGCKCAKFEYKKGEWKRHVFFRGENNMFLLFIKKGQKVTHERGPFPKSFFFFSCFFSPKMPSTNTLLKFFSVPKKPLCFFGRKFITPFWEKKFLSSVVCQQKDRATATKLPSSTSSAAAARVFFRFWVPESQERTIECKSEDLASFYISFWPKRKHRNILTSCRTFIF